MSEPAAPLKRLDFEVAIICALPLEADAVKATFDRALIIGEEERGPRDSNEYALGVIGRHNVVLTTLPGLGKIWAASSATWLRYSYKNIRITLLVGICGAAPSTPAEEIILGDVVIGEGLCVYDYCIIMPSGPVRREPPQGLWGSPGPEVEALLARLKQGSDLQKLIDNTFKELGVLSRALSIEYPGIAEDVLYGSAYRHKHHSLPDCAICQKCKGPTDPVCELCYTAPCSDLNCSITPGIPRRRHAKMASEKASGIADYSKPLIHFGKFGTADTVMKSGPGRDELVSTENVIAFEMEASGIWDVHPCIVVKGVCDYADSHKHKGWQSYAAATAAACAKALLEEIEPKKGISI